MCMLICASVCKVKTAHLYLSHVLYSRLYQGSHSAHEDESHFFSFLSPLRKSFLPHSTHPPLSPTFQLPYYHLSSFFFTSSLMCTFCSSSHLLHYSSCCSFSLLPPPLPTLSTSSLPWATLLFALPRSCCTRMRENQP